jgi:hypothetical protein
MCRPSVQAHKSNVSHHEAAYSTSADYHQFFLYLYRRLVLSEDEAAASFPMR